MEARPNPSEWIVVESGKLEAITDTIHNLKHFEEKTENNFFGKSRLYHFEFETSTGEKLYAQFFQERMNQKTINLVCNHKTGRGRRLQLHTSLMWKNITRKKEKQNTECLIQLKRRNS